METPGFGGCTIDLGPRGGVPVVGRGLFDATMTVLAGDASALSPASARPHNAAAMALKYAAHLANCKKHKPCPPPSEFTATTRVAFRFMKNPSSANDFDPVPVKTGGIKKGDTCNRLGLSFFETLKGARDRFKVLADREDAAERYGSHIGEIKLKPTDGVAGPPGKLTHFDLHQEAAAVFHNRITTYHDLTAKDDDDDAA